MPSERRATARSSLNSFAAAVRFYDEALILGSVSDAHDADTRFRRARSLYMAGGEAPDAALEEARAALLDAGETERAAETDALLAELWWQRGDRGSLVDSPHAGARRCGRSTALARKGPRTRPGRALPDACRRRRRGAQDRRRSSRHGRRPSGSPSSRPTRSTRSGLAKVNLGDLTGLDDLERSIEIATAARAPEAARGYNNLAAIHWGFADIRRARSLVR